MRPSQVRTETVNMVETMGMSIMQRMGMTRTMRWMRETFQVGNNYVKYLSQTIHNRFIMNCFLVDSSDEAATTEIYIIPQDENDINHIYYAMNHCQTLNPDPDESISADDEDGNLDWNNSKTARNLYVIHFVSEDFMEAEPDESDEDAGHGEMRNLHLNDNEDEQFADD